MDAIAVQTHSVLRFTNFSSFVNHIKLGKHTSLRDVTLPLKENRPQFTVKCIESNGNRRGRPSRRSSSGSSGRASKREDEDEKPPVDKKPNSASQEEIIAIFRRIQSSISKEDSTGYDIANSKVSEKESPASSILKVLHESGKKQGKARSEEGNRTMARKRGVPKKEQRVQDYPPVMDSKLTRPPSKFVRRSPIPYATAPRGVPLVPDNGMSGTKELQLPKVEDMKLVELKELAKSRGVKGYSKLKKSELISLLRS